MKFKDLILRVSSDQFIMKKLHDYGGLAITESTPSGFKGKVVCIEFDNNEYRFIPLDTLLLILKEIYGVDYLHRTLNELKYYTDIKDKELK